MRLAASVCAMVLLGTVTAAAQPPQIYANLDVVRSPANTEVFHAGDPVLIGGWQFECHSGLRVKDQRVGEVVVLWVQPTVAQQAKLLAPVIFLRPDVQTAFVAACPAMGHATGFMRWVSSPPSAGEWELRLIVQTWNGAGQLATWQGSKTIQVVQ